MIVYEQRSFLTHTYYVTDYYWNGNESCIAVESINFIRGLTYSLQQVIEFYI